MKRQLILWLLLFTAGCDNFFVNSFSTQGSGKSAVQPMDESFVIQVGKTVRFDREDLSIQFVSVPMDCRCPDGAVCIWEGYVEILLKAQQKDQAPLTLVLSTYGGDSDSVIFQNYSLHLIGLTPYPSLEQERDTTAYQAELRLRRMQ